MYFWDGNEKRALQWAEIKKKAGKVENPAVIGAVLDLGRCFDLLDSSNIYTLKEYYKLIISDSERAGIAIPDNIDHPRDKGDRKLRYLTVL